MIDQPVILITGTSQGIGRHLAEHYAGSGFHVIGVSRGEAEPIAGEYTHHRLDITDEKAVRSLFSTLGKNLGRLDVLINNAGIAAMNHILLTPLATLQKILETNVSGTFLFCREAAKLMQRQRVGRIVNMSTVAVPLKLEGEAAYAASKAAVVTLTEILARELGTLGITVNAIGPAPIETRLIRSVPRQKIDRIVQQQAIKRRCEFRDITNVVDFFIRPESDFVTGQVIYLGGV